MSGTKYICKSSLFGDGTQKNAFNVTNCNSTDTGYFVVRADIENEKLCIVVFKDVVTWKSPQPGYKEFITKMKNDPQFKIEIRKAIQKFEADSNRAKFMNSNYEIDLNDLTTDHKLIFSLFGNLKNYNFLKAEIDKEKSEYDKEKLQYDYIDELKKMYTLGKKGLAPKLYQIRINDMLFSPENIDAEIAKITPHQLCKISFLVEKCDIDIVSRIGQKINEFCDKYVDDMNEVYCDLKFENICPTIVGGTIESIRLLDVDLKYVVKPLGATATATATATYFKRNAKVFMKFLLFSQSKKYNHMHFTDWFITAAEVIEMINFFSSPYYMDKYEYNPINMLYYYLISTDYKFVPFDVLEKLNITTSVFDPYIKLIPIDETSSKKGGSTLSKKRIKRKFKKIKLSTIKKRKYIKKPLFALRK